MVTGFFKKLKNKLFNSSSKFTKNLDEAVNEVSKAEVDVNIEKKVSVEKSEKNEINSKKISESEISQFAQEGDTCLLYTSPSPRDLSTSRMPSSA